MSSIFTLYEGAKSIAIAGIYHLPSEFNTFELSEYIRIVPANEEIEKLYLPRLAHNVIKPSYYIIGIAPDKRFCTTSRKINDCKDAESSITLAHLSLCIYFMVPYYIGPVYGFNSEGSPCAFCISEPPKAGMHWELDDDVLRPQVSPLVGISSFNRKEFAPDFVDFFKKVGTAYAEIKDARWIFAAFKYLSGLTQYYSYNAVLDFSVAIETLVNRGEQVSFTTRYYMALLVGNTYAERVIIQNDIKDFYSLRSKLIHGSAFSISEVENKLISNVSKHLAKALINTCGKRIKQEIFPEIDYLSLIGSPSYSTEKVTFVITVDEIVEVIKSIEKFEDIDSYKAYMSRMDEDGDRDLLIELNVKGKKVGPFDASTFLWSHPKMNNMTRYSYWVSSDENNNYAFLVTAIKS